MTSFQRRSFELPNATLSNRIDRTRRGGVDSIENITLCATSSDKIASIDRWIRSRILGKFLDELSTFRFRSTRAAIELFHKKSIDTKISPRRNKRERERDRKKGKVRYIISKHLANKSLDLLSATLHSIPYYVQRAMFLKNKTLHRINVFKRSSSKVASYPQYPRFFKKRRRKRSKIIRRNLSFSSNQSTSINLGLQSLIFFFFFLLSSNSLIENILNCFIYALR